MIKFHYWCVCTFLKIDKWYAWKIHRIPFYNMTISSWWGHLIKTGQASGFHLWMNKHLRFLDAYLDWVGVIDGRGYDYSDFGHCERWIDLYDRGDNFVSLHDGKIYYGNTWRNLNAKKTNS